MVPSPVSLTSLPPIRLPGGTPSSILKPTAGNGHGVVFGRGSPSRLLLPEVEGGGCRRRAMTALSRRSMTYGADDICGYDFVRSGMVSVEAGSKSSGVLALFSANDVSYAMVARMIWSKTIKRSKDKSRNFEGGACPVELLAANHLKSMYAVRTHANEVQDDCLAV